MLSGDGSALEKREKAFVPVTLVSLLQGIEWTNIEYFNNAVICDLIENVSVSPELLD